MFMEKEHGNLTSNPADHHLYEIIDKVDDDIFKYGISGKKLRADGSSPRAEKQVRILNLAVNWKRFRSNILLTKIKGRMLARKIEDEHIEAYEKKHGHCPRGNPPPRK